MTDVDLTLDFDAYLTAAKAQWKAEQDKLTPISKKKYSLVMAGKPVDCPEYRELEKQEFAIKAEYKTWIDENLYKRGMQLVKNPWDGEPEAIFVQVAGKKSRILSASAIE